MWWDERGGNLAGQMRGQLCCSRGRHGCAPSCGGWGGFCPGGKYAPTMFPGLPSSPKKSFCMSSASPSCVRSLVRPSMPASSEPGLDCMARATDSTVRFRRPFLSTWNLFLGSLEKRPCKQSVSKNQANKRGPSRRARVTQGVGALTILYISKLAIARPSDRRYVRPFSALLKDH